MAVLLGAQDHREVVNQPLSVDEDEFVAEGVFGDVFEHALHVVRVVEPVDCPDVDGDSVVASHFPQTARLGHEMQHKFEGKSECRQSKSPVQKRRVRKRIIRRSNHSCESQIKQQDSPTRQTGGEVVLGAKAQAVHTPEQVIDRLV